MYTEVTPGMEAVQTGLTGLVGDLTTLVTSNIPLVIGFVGLMIAIPFAIKFIRKFVK